MSEQKCQCGASTSACEHYIREGDCKAPEAMSELKWAEKNKKISIAMRGNKNSLRHGHAIHGTKGSPTYRSWLAMKTRCYTHGRDNADRYVDRGVKICERWESFDNFLADMGERPKGKTLDRWPNINGNYEPANCRWATPTEQARNTRRNVLDFESATKVAVMRLQGIKCKDIAAQFSISESLPREIVKGRCWVDALEKAKQILENEK